MELQQSSTRLHQNSTGHWNIQWLTKPFQCFALFERWVHIKCNKLYKVLILLTSKHQYVGHMYTKSRVDLAIFETFFM
jgi:hypothetical protein